MTSGRLEQISNRNVAPYGAPRPSLSDISNQKFGLLSFNYNYWFRVLQIFTNIVAVYKNIIRNTESLGMELLEE